MDPNNGGQLLNPNFILNDDDDEDDHFNGGRVPGINLDNVQQPPSESSVSSSPRSIPEEHDLSMSFEEHYLENYQCLMKGITWGRESHGLFDYGTRHPLKKQMKTEVEQVLVRTNNNDLLMVDMDTDIATKFDKQGQPLLNILKKKSKLLYFHSIDKYYLEALKVEKTDDL